MSDPRIAGMVMINSTAIAKDTTQDETAGEGGRLSAAVERTPVYFGPASRPLFGWYHAPRNGKNLPLAVVICPPLGHEYVNAHRSLRHLADRCAAAGVPALRFDYDGTGDSAGMDEDPGRLDAWQASIREAMALLQRLSGCREIGLVGLRIGATLATLTASQQAVSCLVLWAPCVRGQAYVREMKALQLTGGAQLQQPGATAPGDIEAGGFVYSEQTTQALRGLNLATMAPKAGRILIVSRDDFIDNAALSSTWSQAGSKVETFSFSGYQEMMAEPHNTRIPADAIGGIAAWLASVAIHQTREIGAGTPAAENSQAIQFAASDACAGMPPGSRREIRESIVQFGPTGSRFGILSEPAGATSQSVPTIILSNAGAVHHIGASRLYVLLSRALSSAGFRCFRIDLPGLGDSVIDTPDLENDVYLPSTSAELALAIDALEKKCQSGSFVLAGLCSGAHASFHASLDLAGKRIAECVLINPLTFYYKRGMSLDQQPTRHFRDWQDYKAAIRSPTRWLNLLRGRGDVTRVMSTFAIRARVKVEARFRSLRRRWSSGNPTAAATDDLEGDLMRLAGSGPAITFTFSRGEPGYELLTTHAGATVKKLVRQGRASIWFIDNADHIFAAKQPRCEFIETMVRHLLHRYRTGA